MTEFFAQAGVVTGEIFVWLLCLVGLLLSCLSLSGTWLVLLATMIAAWLSGPEFPGWITPAVFLAICLGVEFLEFIAGKWGVEKRGGSRAAGWAALGGSLLGSVVGGMIIPLIGSLIGMLIGGFAAAFAVEHRRLKQTEHAAHIAFGTVLARLMSMLLKVLATLLMIGILIWGMVTR
jgi:uncharacterized protein YqgC (DUF456 family)